MTKTFKTVGVIGSGTMGAGIAQVLALSGYKTILYDLNSDILKAAFQRIEKTIQKGIERQKLPENALAILGENLKTTMVLEDFRHAAELVIEAVPEEMSIKQKLFEQLDQICPPETFLASNTSSFSITALASITKRPQRFAGMHFFNPVPLMTLVEVIQGKQTDMEYCEQLCDLAKSLGKTPVKVKDTPGFIVNRVARAFYGEAIRLLGDGVADVATIDTIMREEGGFRMGPFELMDLIGIDINYAVTQSVYEAYFQEPRFKPHWIQQQMVAAGHLGRKSGQGFYHYDS